MSRLTVFASLLLCAGAAHANTPVLGAGILATAARLIEVAESPACALERAQRDQARVAYHALPQLAALRASPAMQRLQAAEIKRASVCTLFSGADAQCQTASHEADRLRRQLFQSCALRDLQALPEAQRITALDNDVYGHGCELPDALGYAIVRSEGAFARGFRFFDIMGEPEVETDLRALLASPAYAAFAASPEHDAVTSAADGLFECQVVHIGDGLGALGGAGSEDPCEAQRLALHDASATAEAGADWPMVVAEPTHRRLLARLTGDVACTDLNGM